MSTYNRSEIYPVEFQVHPNLYPLIHRITTHRLAGHELDRRRPSVLLRLVADDEFIVRIQPKLLSSPTGWELDARIPIKLVKIDGGKTHIAVNLHTQGHYLFARWKRDTDETLRGKAILESTLDLMAGDLRKAFAHLAENCCVCGRALSDPQSMERGIGPECWGGMGPFLSLGEDLLEDQRAG